MASPGDWIEQFRMLKIGTRAGLGLVDLWKKLATSGPRSLRLDNQTVAEVLHRGQGLTEAMVLVQHWPPMVRVLLGIGEQTSHLPEICEELVRYFETIRTNRRLFWQRAFWPILQLVMAIGVIGLLILILGFLPAANQGGYDPLGFGLKGASGLAIYLAVVAGIVFCLGLGFFGLRTVFRSGSVDRWLDLIPYVGGMRRSFTQARFSMALSLMGKTGLGWDKGLRHALDATNNTDWLTRGAKSISRVKKGSNVTPALALTGLFDDEYLGRVGVGEESGALPEVLGQIAEDSFEEGRQRMAIVAVFAAQLAWLCTAMIIIFFIVRLYGSYLSQLGNIG